MGDHHPGPPPHSPHERERPDADSGRMFLDHQQMVAGHGEADGVNRPQLVDEVGSGGIDRGLRCDLERIIEEPRRQVHEAAQIIEPLGGPGPDGPDAIAQPGHVVEQPHAHGVDLEQLGPGKGAAQKAQRPRRQPLAEIRQHRVAGIEGFRQPRGRNAGRPETLEQAPGLGHQLRGDDTVSGQGFLGVGAEIGSAEDAPGGRRQSPDAEFPGQGDQHLALIGLDLGNQQMGRLDTFEEGAIDAVDIGGPGQLLAGRPMPEMPLFGFDVVKDVAGIAGQFAGVEQGRQSALLQVGQGQDVGVVEYLMHQVVMMGRR